MLFTSYLQSGWSSTATVASRVVKQKTPQLPDIPVNDIHHTLAIAEETWPGRNLSEQFYQTCSYLANYRKLPETPEEYGRLHSSLQWAADHYFWPVDCDGVVHATWMAIVQERLILEVS